MPHLVSIRGRAPTVNEMDHRISMLHGAGGELMGDLLDRLILPRFSAVTTTRGGVGLSALDDGATVDVPAGERVVVTTDSHVVKPIFFPGGDIGRLAAAGTINDLVMMGARPIGLTLAAIIEEGFPIAHLERILDSFARVLETVGAAVVCGDTKVMPAGDLDGIALNTTGVGATSHVIGDAGLHIGDAVIVTGTIGDHGMALLAAREEFHLSTPLQSDVAPLWPFLAPVIERYATQIHGMKDPTRGGLAAALNEMARKSATCIVVDDAAIPMRSEVVALSDVLGISPLTVANEGKAILVVAGEVAEDVVRMLTSHKLGTDARRIGRVTEEYPGRVLLETEVGGRRFLDMPLGDPVPRIC